MSKRSDEQEKPDQKSKKKEKKKTQRTYTTVQEDLMPRSKRTIIKYKYV